MTPPGVCWVFSMVHAQINSKTTAMVGSLNRMGHVAFRLYTHNILEMFKSWPLHITQNIGLMSKPLFCNGCQMLQTVATSIINTLLQLLVETAHCSALPKHICLRQAATLTHQLP